MRRRVHWRTLVVVGLLAFAVAAMSGVAAAATGKAKPGARLTGVWTVNGTATAGQNAEIFNIVSGPGGTRSWTFKPKCRKGACDTLLTRETATSTHDIQLTYKGRGRYTGVDNLSLLGLTCDTPPIEVPGGWVGQSVWTVKVTKTKIKHGVPVATRISAGAAFTLDQTPEFDAISGCTSPLVEYRFDYTGVKR